MTDQEIIDKLKSAEDGDQVPFPDEATKQRAFQLCRSVTHKTLFITTQQDYDLWLKRPFGNAPMPGS
jgi:hypothetical protein